MTIGGGSSGSSSSSSSNSSGASSPAPPSPSSRKGESGLELVVFDFDETIIGTDSDTYINLLAPGATIPAHLWNTFLDERDWTAYMQQVFAYLHSHGITAEDYRRCLATVPFVEGMDRLLKHLGAGSEKNGKKFEVVIISDANSFFISHVLECHKLSHVIKKVFTNPATFDPTGHLRIERYHEQDWCRLSARNLCKGHILEQYIRERATSPDGPVTFDRINYVGDGQNDLCPSLRLSAHDRVFPRAGFPLHKLLVAQNSAATPTNEQEQQGSEVSSSKQLAAKVTPYTTGDDIWLVLSQ